MKWRNQKHHKNIHVPWRCWFINKRYTQTIEMKQKNKKEDLLVNYNFLGNGLAGRGVKNISNIFYISITEQLKSSLLLLRKTHMFTLMLLIMIRFSI